MLSNPNLAAGQIGVDQVAQLELEPELIQDLEAQGGEKEYRGPDDPSRSIAAIQTELAGAGPVAGPATDAPGCSCSGCSSRPTSSWKPS